MTWLLIVLLVLLLICVSPLFDRVWQLVPVRVSSARAEQAAWLSFGLVLLVTLWALWQALTFTLGSHSTTGGSLARWAISLLGLAGCWYVWNSLQRAHSRG